MKCDELKPLVFSLNDLAYVDESVVKKNFDNPHNHAVYKATEVDEAIAELKQKLMPCLNGDCILTCEVVEKYGKENAELKQKLEDVKASHYAEMVDAGMENGRLKEAQRWRKCSEEMPEDGAEVLASDGDGIWLCYKTTICDGSPWFQPDGLPHIKGVTHWMPLPKAPEEK